MYVCVSAVQYQFHVRCVKHESIRSDIGLKSGYVMLVR